MEGKEKIACPKCDWEPEIYDVWQCSCGYIWNTFITGGRCPSCGIIWKDTQCLSCRKWSPHIDWYRDLDDFLEEELQSINKRKLVPTS